MPAAAGAKSQSGTGAEGDGDDFQALAVEIVGLARGEDPKQRGEAPPGDRGDVPGEGDRTAGEHVAAIRPSGLKPFPSRMRPSKTFSVMSDEMGIPMIWVRTLPGPNYGQTMLEDGAQPG